MAKALTQLERYTEAIHLWKKRLKTAAKFENDITLKYSQILENYEGLIEAYLKSGNEEKVLDICKKIKCFGINQDTPEETKPIFKDTKVAWEVANICAFKSHAYTSLGDLDKSNEWLAHAVSIYSYTGWQLFESKSPNAEAILNFIYATAAGEIILASRQIPENLSKYRVALKLLELLPTIAKNCFPQMRVDTSFGSRILHLQTVAFKFLVPKKNLLMFLDYWSDYHVQVKEEKNTIKLYKNSLMLSEHFKTRLQH